MSTDDTFLDEYRRLKTWLINSAYPVWWRNGADHEAGGFHACLTLGAFPTAESRPARLHPRLFHAFAAARELGWNGPCEDATRHGLDFFVKYHFRSDGLVRAAVDSRGAAVEESAVLNDQACALLGFAAAFSQLHDERWLQMARALRDEVIAAFGQPLGFDERLDHSPPLLASSHLHLLQACLAWRELDHRGWYDIASNIVELAIERMLHPHTHVISEFFERNWLPLASDQGRLVQAGHLFAWGSALLQWAIASRDSPLERHALRLIDVAEHSSHRQRQVAMNSLALHHDMLVVNDGRARLWAQTERIKALIMAARLTADSRYVSNAAKALHSLRRYLDVPTAGLWHDTMNTDGTFVTEPARASSLFHLVCAVQECERYSQVRASKAVP
jgi:mannose/cellobiose epimerase-like protein (N-acyl-D-glucosamine 2-epimerase family)